MDFTQEWTKARGFEIGTSNSLSSIFFNFEALPPSHIVIF